jgi:hypothetical protein
VCIPRGTGTSSSALSVRAGLHPAEMGTLVSIRTTVLRCFGAPSSSLRLERPLGAAPATTKSPATAERVTKGPARRVPTRTLARQARPSQSVASNWIGLRTYRSCALCGFLRVAETGACSQARDATTSLTSTPSVPADSGLSTGSPADAAGSSRSRPEAAGGRRSSDAHETYALSGPSRSIPGENEFELLRLRVLRRVRIAGHRGLLLKAAPYPSGGVHGGHIAAVWSQDGAGYAVSLHFEHRGSATSREARRRAPSRRGDEPIYSALS